MSEAVKPELDAKSCQSNTEYPVCTVISAGDEVSDQREEEEHHWERGGGKIIDAEKRDTEASIAVQCHVHCAA